MVKATGPPLTINQQGSWQTRFSGSAPLAYCTHTRTQDGRAHGCCLSPLQTVSST